MSDDCSPPPAGDGAAPLAARVAAAERRTAERDATACADLLLGTRDRLDDRTRAAAAALLERAVATIADEVRDAALRRLTNGPALIDYDVPARLQSAGLLRDPDLVAEAIAQARAASIAAGLVATRPPTSAPGLLARLNVADEASIRVAAAEYLAADNRRRSCGGDLPEMLHRRLAWWCAAAFRERLGGEADEALAEAAERSVATRRERGDTAEAAIQLASAIGATVTELPVLLLGALHDGGIDLFVALLSHALGIDTREVRALVLDPTGDRLWAALRAAGLARADVARVGWALCEADAAREVEALPAALDGLDGVTAMEAAQLLRTLTLGDDFRAAIRALDRSAA